MARRALLIDADVLAFQCASANEKATDWGDGYWTWHCDEQAVKDDVEAKIEQHLDELNADTVVLCLTDDGRNFRKDILPTYKGNRSGVKRPLLLKHIKQWMIDEHEAYIRPGLEGDDVMGILATWNKFMPKHEKVIVSIDKDMQTIPGLYCRDLETGIVEVPEDEADRWHMIQTLSGDPTDGYSGCPGLGTERAVKVVDDPRELEEYEHTITRGARKGEVETRWREADECDIWTAVVAQYRKAGLGEEEALVQARVARILRAEDYDFKKKEPRLWQPQ